MDFTVTSAKTRYGLENVFVYDGAEEVNAAGLGVDIPVTDAEAWDNPDNISFNTPGTYASVSLNVATPVFTTINSSGNLSITPVTSVTFLPGFAFIAGELVFMEVRITFGNTVSSIVDTDGNVWTKIAGVQMASTIHAPGKDLEVWVGTITTNGTPNITVNFSGSTIYSLAWWDARGLIALNGTPVAQAGVTSGSDYTTGPMTTTATTVLFFLGIADGFVLTPTAPAGSWAGSGAATDYLVGVPAGAITVDAPLNTTEANQAFAGIVWAYTAGTGAPGPNDSDILRATDFAFTIPLTSSVIGIEISVNGKQSATNLTYTIAPISGGAATTFQLQSTDSSFTIGGPGEFPGYTSPPLPATVNNPGFGYTLTAAASGSGEAIADVSGIAVTIWYTPPGVHNFDWVKTFAMQNGNVLTLALDDTGVLWQENVQTTPGVLTPFFTAIEPDTFAQSVTYDDREWIALSDLSEATDMPRQYNGQWTDRVSQVGPGAPPSISATANEYDVVSITQPAAVTVRVTQWTSSVNGHTPGNLLILGEKVSINPNFLAGVMVGSAVYLQLTGVDSRTGTNFDIADGTYLVNSTGQTTGLESGSTTVYNYFTVQALSTEQLLAFDNASGVGTYQLTLATLTTAQPIPNVQVGSQISLAGVTPSSWNATWTVLFTPNAAQLTITSTSLSANIATYDYTLVTGTAPVTGEQVTVTMTNNGDGIFNVVDAIITSAGVNTFSIPLSGSDVSAAAEDGQAIVNGTIFQFDPGVTLVGTVTDPIFGTGSGGTVSQPGNLGAGQRQCVVMFITRNDLLTGCSPPITFNLTEGANSLVAVNIPIGPPNVTKRALAFTGAGGAFFFFIEQPVTITDNGQQVTYTSTVVNDNISTQATFTFTDAVLLAGTSIDTSGSDNFEQIELGSSLGFVAYQNRMFAWGEQNKIQNLINLSFDGGYLPNPPAANQPLGWTVDPTDGGNGSLAVSPLFGNAYYILNATGSPIAGPTGMITQTAFQDFQKQPILNTNTQYGVRVTASCPGAVAGSANLVIDLYSPSFGTQYGEFVVPLASMGTGMQIFTGNLLLTEFFSAVPSDILLRIYATDLDDGGDVMLDRVEPFDLSQPVLTTQLRGSYENNFEAFDDVSGNLGVAVENQQEVRCAFELFDNLYIVKTGSMVSTTDNGVTEPDEWDVKEVSNKVGTPSIHGVDVGEGWALIAGEPGIYIFEGGKPQKISPEIDPLWATVRWQFGETLWIRNDTNSRRISIGVPLPTPNQWMPQFPVNLFPEEPNVVLICAYKELMTGGALANEGPIRQSYSGELRSYQLGRKWSVWSIEAAYGDFIQREDTTAPLFYCGDTGTAKIYQQLTGSFLDDFEAIPWRYTTYPFLKSAEAQQLHAGLHELLATYASMTVVGEDFVNVTILPDTLGTPYGDALQALPLANPPAYGDTEFPLNTVGTRFFVDFQPFEAGDWMELSRLVLNITQNPWAPVRGSN